MKKARFFSAFFAIIIGLIFFPFASHCSAKPFAEGVQRMELCLNGDLWECHIGGKDSEMPAENWQERRVPSIWDRVFTKTFFDLDDTGICYTYAKMGENGHSLWYRTTFFVPAGWQDGRRVVLAFEGLEHYGRILVNG